MGMQHGQVYKGKKRHVRALMFVKNFGYLLCSLKGRLCNIMASLSVPAPHEASYPISALGGKVGGVGLRRVYHKLSFGFALHFLLLTGLPPGMLTFTHACALLTIPQQSHPWKI